MWHLSDNAAVSANMLLLIWGWFKWELNDEEHIPQATMQRDYFYAREVSKVIALRLLIYETISGVPKVGF